MLPHDLFASLFAHHRLVFDEVFGVERLGEFWDGASRPDRANVMLCSTSHVSFNNPCPTPASSNSVHAVQCPMPRPKHVWHWNAPG
eukprot:8775472-Pyramimonas_sp.AAC.1